ncbi:MAG: hypothetical protein JXC32_19880 [Anaerolineae bacterium]|nr:hypothetical protein [Anaerolineae bacterium]
MKRKLSFILSTVLLWLSTGLPLQAETPPHLGYGMMLAYPPGSLDEVTAAGFDWFKYFAYWNDVDGNRDRSYDWRSVDARLDEACEHGVNLLLRVERDDVDWTPIQDHEMAGWEAFFADLAAHIAVEQAKCASPYRVALEVWNEPNLDFQWGYQDVDPARYTEMVKRAYRGAKAGAPQSLVVVGSLAPTGGLSEGRAMNDVSFLEAMYAAGLKGHFDAISVHNYGFGGEPEDKDHGGGILNFRRAEDIHAVMVAHGDGDLPVWGTEFGWLLASSECNSYWEQIGFAWQQVTAQQQADYLTRAFAYADANWPWMEVMVVSNLDFSRMPWYQTCEPLRWFSILEEDGAPRPAYTALTEMPKRPRSWGSWGMALAPTAITWMQTISDTQVISRTVSVLNTGERPFQWTATTASSPFTLTVAPISGDAGATFTVTADPRGLIAGTYAMTVTITASESEVPESPIQLPVRICVAAKIYSVYLPTVQRH